MLLGIIADTTLSGPAGIINELFVLSGMTSVAIISFGSERVESFKEEEEELIMRSCTAVQRRFSRQLRMLECEVYSGVQWSVQSVIESGSTMAQPPPRYRQLYVDRNFTNINTYISPASPMFYGGDNVPPVCRQYANVILFLLFFSALSLAVSSEP